MVDLSRVDILEVIGADTTVKRTASTNGGEHSGPCPFCGGTDRFNVWPDHPSGRGRWWCRQCGRSGDAVDYLRKHDRLGFVKACRALGIEPGDRQVVPTERSTHRRRERGPARASMPNKRAAPPTWDIRAAEETLKACESMLWNQEGETALTWLRKRGLTDETIRQRRLGFNPTKRSLNGLWVWQGIVIPCLVDGRIWYMKVRRSSPGPKYKQLKGSGQFALYGLELVHGKSAVAICESEFDAMVLHQEAGDLVDVVATGGAGHRPCPSSLAELLSATYWIVALDRDKAGDGGARWWADFSSRVHRVRPLQGNDITDFYLEGGDLRAWVIYHLDRMGVDLGFNSVERRRAGHPDHEFQRSGIEHRADDVLARCEGSENWTREWAQLAEAVGWSCFGMTWQEWAAEVRDYLDETVKAENAQIPDAEGEPQELVHAAKATQCRSGMADQDGDLPTEPCRSFGMGEHRFFWKGPGGWICAVCHPPALPDVDYYDLPDNENVEMASSVGAARPKRTGKRAAQNSVQRQRVESEQEINTYARGGRQ